MERNLNNEMHKRAENEESEQSILNLKMLIESPPPKELVGLNQSKTEKEKENKDNINKTNNTENKENIYITKVSKTSSANIPEDPVLLETLKISEYENSPKDGKKV